MLVGWEGVRGRGLVVQSLEFFLLHLSFSGFVILNTTWDNFFFITGGESTGYQRKLPRLFSNLYSILNSLIRRQLQNQPLKKSAVLLSI